MRKNFLTILVAALGLTVALAIGGCGSGDDNNPTIPDPVGTGQTGDDMDPNIPGPFTTGPAPGAIIDIGIEGDGDIVLAGLNGIHLYTPYGVFKRLMSPDPALAIATSNQSTLDTGRGVTVLMGGQNCMQFRFYDDQYVIGGVGHTRYHPVWWGGEADPFYPDECWNHVSSSPFESCPRPYANAFTYHPETHVCYQRVNAPICIADGDCEWADTNAVEPGGGGPAILAYHPIAPPHPEMIVNWFVGHVDFVVYYDGNFWASMQNLAAFLVVPPCFTHNAPIEWDFTNPLGNFESDRDGMSAGSIWDFEFDALNRLIIVLNEADSIAITDPVVFPNNIRIQMTIGGRQNGMGTLPGEFYGPTAVAIDPRNQEIYVSDTGNGRVQVFDSGGNFKREFGGADPDFIPGAIRIDAFGAVYVANMADSTLSIFNEYGTPIIYGTLEGWVRDKNTHLPIDGARVLVHSTFAQLSAFTGEDGHFIFDAVATGTHNLTAEKYGYTSGYTVAAVTGGQKTVIDITIEKTAIGPPGFGTVTGTVQTSGWNEPIVGLHAGIVGESMSTQTNANGEFTLYSVPEGEQTFQLSHEGIVYFTKYITVTKGGVLDLGIIELDLAQPPW